MKFFPGLSFAEMGIHFRVSRGNRCEGDMVMDISIDGKKWIRPTISHTFILTEFKYQVEENNYGKDGKIKRGGEGGEYLMRHIAMP